jgi:hypothetical protein
MVQKHDLHKTQGEGGSTQLKLPLPGADAKYLKCVYNPAELNSSTDVHTGLRLLSDTQ